jgi:hypothetical protein
VKAVAVQHTRALAVFGDWRAAWAVLGVLCLCSAFVFFRTPFVVDLPLMHFVAWRVSEGDIPYADLWEMNGPTPYMAHQLMLLSPLSPHATMAVVMTLMTTVCVASVAAIAGRGGRVWLGLAMAIAVLAWVLARGNEYLVQRDMMIAVYAVAALALVSSAGARAWRWGAAGVLIGLAAGVKPTAAPYALIALGAAVWSDVGDGRGFRRTLWLVGGGALGGAIWIGWLVATGGFPGFWTMMLGYNPGFMTIARVSFGELIAEPTVWLALAGATGCGFAVHHQMRAKASCEDIAFLAMAGAFALVGGATYILQGKGWAYHTAPAAVLSVAAMGAALASVRDLRGPRRAGLVAAGVLASCAAALPTVQGQLGPIFAANMQMRVDIARDMAASLDALPPGMKVQPLDTTDGALNAMWQARRTQASPVIYDFWLFEGAPDAVANSRAAVLQAMRSSDAPAILMTNEGWPQIGTGYARMGRFAEFQSLLAERYALIDEGGGGRFSFRLYAPR